MNSTTHAQIKSDLEQLGKTIVFKCIFLRRRLILQALWKTLIKTCLSSFLLKCSYFVTKASNSLYIPWKRAWWPPFLSILSFIYFLFYLLQQRTKLHWKNPRQVLNIRKSPRSTTRKDERVPIILSCVTICFLLDNIIIFSFQRFCYLWIPLELNFSLVSASLNFWFSAWRVSKGVTVQISPSLRPPICFIRCLCLPWKGCTVQLCFKLGPVDTHM